MDALTRCRASAARRPTSCSGHALGVPGLPVDRHVLRVANRIGLAEGDDPETVEAQLCGALPTDTMDAARRTLLILHGRRICKPKPLCDQCAVRDECEFVRVLDQERSSAPVRKAREAAKAKKPVADRKPAAVTTAPASEDENDDGGSGRNSEESIVERASFERLVAEALSDIPEQFRNAMQNLTIIVEDEPSPDLLREMEIAPPDTLFGLYTGTPLTERDATFGNNLPDRILIFQGPHEREAEDDEDLIVSIAETLIHEIGHYFGMDEDQIEEIEAQYLGTASVRLTTKTTHELIQGTASPRHG